MVFNVSRFKLQKGFVYRRSVLQNLTDKDIFSAHFSDSNKTVEATALLFWFHFIVHGLTDN